MHVRLVRVDRESVSRRVIDCLAAPFHSFFAPSLPSLSLTSCDSFFFTPLPKLLSFSRRLSSQGLVKNPHGAHVYMYMCTPGARHTRLPEVVTVSPTTERRSAVLRADPMFTHIPDPARTSLLIEEVEGAMERLFPATADQEAGEDSF